MRNNSQAWPLAASSNRNGFLPASRYYGDKYARTMEEAFGPGAELEAAPEESDPFVCMLLGAVFVVGAVSLAACVLWYATR